MTEAPIGVNIADPNVRFMDANGEGHADLVVFQNGMSGYFTTDYNTGWNSILVIQKKGGERV